MDRFIDDGVLRNLDERAVLEERRVQRDERVGLEARVATEVLLEDARLRAENLRHRHDPNALWQGPEVREAGRITAVHEHDAARLQHAEGEGVELLGDDAVRTCQDRRLERNPEERREVRVFPFLVLLRREAKGLET